MTSPRFWQAYWALPLLLGQPEAWDDRSLLACAELLHAHLTRGAPCADGAAPLLGAIHAQPVLAALLALRRVDGAALRAAAPRCGAAERARVLRLAQASAGFEGKARALATQELAAHDQRGAAKRGMSAAHRAWAQRR